MELIKNGSTGYSRVNYVILSMLLFKSTVASNLRLFPKKAWFLSHMRNKFWYTILYKYHGLVQHSVCEIANLRDIVFSLWEQDTHFLIFALRKIFFLKVYPWFLPWLRCYPVITLGWNQIICPTEKLIEWKLIKKPDPDPPKKAAAYAKPAVRIDREKQTAVLSRLMLRYLLCYHLFHAGWTKSCRLSCGSEGGGGSKKNCSSC